MGIVDLPESLLIYIYSFLCCESYSVNWKIPGLDQRNDLNWLCFLNTTNRFQELKHHTLYLSFNETHSERFLKDRGYRALIEKVILKNTAEQLGLHFQEKLPSKSFYPHFSHLHTLKLEYIEHIPMEMIQFVSFLSLWRCSFQSNSSLKSQKIIIAAEVVSFDCMQEALDFEKFQFQHIARLYLLNVEVSHLSKFDDCSTLSDMFLREVTSTDEEAMDCSRINSINVDNSYFSCLHSTQNVRYVNFYDLAGRFEDPVALAIDECRSMKKLFLKNLRVESPLEQSESLKQLLSLTLISVRLVTLETSLFPCLKELFIEHCHDLEKLILNNSSLVIFRLTGDITSKKKYDLELIDFQSPSLKRVVVKNMTAVKSPVKCVLKNNNNVISNFIVENSSLHFVKLI
jgi:hypothetical protein